VLENKEEEEEEDKKKKKKKSQGMSQFCLQLLSYRFRTRWEIKYYELKIQTKKK
jgi:hypothetical protein